MLQMKPTETPTLLCLSLNRGSNFTWMRTNRVIFLSSPIMSLPRTGNCGPHEGPMPQAIQQGKSIYFYKGLGRHLHSFNTRPLFSSMVGTSRKRARESSPASETPRQVRTKLSAFEERYETATKSNEDVLSKSLHYSDYLFF
jgi:hypothetical protein